jgi:beta-1,4-mannosyl-glycoprotein beta-1,4-N-acetylglucosaminyltransferase
MKRSFWRKKSIQLIDDGGWHFNYLLKPEQISQKIKSFAHNEFNKEIYFNIDKIIYRINNQIDPFDRPRIYEKLNFTKENFPQFLIDNQSNLKDWIL